MKNFSVIRDLVGESVRKEELVNVDCYVTGKLGLFIPSVGRCEYARRIDHTHPSYMIMISFTDPPPVEALRMECRPNYYPAVAVSPDIPHTDPSEQGQDYYCILIEREYFEQQYRLYTPEVPCLNWKPFTLCGDILKVLNTFAFEYTKDMQNSDITLEAQATVLTHWLIRSMLGENLDMRMVSSVYAVARVQHFMEQHYEEAVTVARLAELGHMSVSSFNRIFKKEMNLTPMKYLNEIRIQKSKLMLRRKEIPITEVAAKCGFSSSAHYAAAFRQYTGIAPSQYRDCYK